MRGLMRLTYYCNRLQALDDFKQLAAVVERAGHADLVGEFQHQPNASIKQIDQAIDKLRQAYQARIGSKPTERKP